MTDIVTRLHLRDEYEVMLDHLNQPYGLAKSLEHEAADEIERLRAEATRLRETLDKIFSVVADWPVPEDGATFHEIMMRDAAMMAPILAALKETGHD